LRSAFLGMVLACGLLPSCQSVIVVPSRDLDDALLLTLASHEQLDLGREAAKASGGGLLVVRLGPQAAEGENPHHELRDMYSKMAEEAEAEGGPVYDFYVKRAEEHNRLAAELDAARACRNTRRSRGLQRIFRTIARGPIIVARAVGIGVKEMLRFAKTVILIAVDEVPRLARQYVERKIREMGALLQGRIDLVWDKIADRVGLPFAGWLRRRVDRAFVRQRDRLLADPHGKPSQTQAPANAEFDRQIKAFEKAGVMVASCEYQKLTLPEYAGTNLSSIPFEFKLDLNNDTFSYHIDAEGHYEDYQKCNVTVTVDGAGVMAGEEGWLQGEETMASLTSCYLLNVQTGEKFFAEPLEGGWKSEIAGFVVPSPWTLYWCPVGPMGDVNTMMRAGTKALIASGNCQACPSAVAK
jgi:hypothetical protein